MPPHNNLPHYCVVRRNTAGMYYASCTCGYEGIAVRSQIPASSMRENHLKQAMSADVGATWNMMLSRDELPEEPANRSN